MAEGGSVPPKTVSQDLRRIAKSIWDRSANFTVYERITGYKALTPPLPLEFIYSMAEHLHSAKNHTIGAKHMLQFVDGRFHAHGVSFTMPDGFYLHDEMFHPFALCCLSPNQRYTLRLRSPQTAGRFCRPCKPFLKRTPACIPLPLYSRSQ